MYDRKYIASTDGNVSVRLSSRHLLVTPSGVHKGLLSPDQIVVTDLSGKLVRGKSAPSSELKMHLKVYEERGDVNAVVHAHPPISLAYSVAGKSLSIPALTEVVLALGEIPIAPYATPTTSEVPEAIGSLIKNYDAMILDRHGSLTVGRTLQDAYNLLEKIEHAAEVMLYATLLGGVRPLPEKETERLTELGKRLGLRRETNTQESEDEKLIQQLTAEILKQLQKS